MQSGSQSRLTRSRRSRNTCSALGPSLAASPQHCNKHIASLTRGKEEHFSHGRRKRKNQEKNGGINQSSRGLALNRAKRKKVGNGQAGIVQSSFKGGLFRSRIDSTSHTRPAAKALQLGPAVLASAVLGEG